jgi:hypothetical protein
MKGFAGTAVTYLFIGSILVLFIMNPGGFVADTGAAGSAIGNETKLLSGSGYKKAS